jgi:hypothetical protein
VENRVKLSGEYNVVRMAAPPRKIRRSTQKAPLTIVEYVAHSVEICVIRKPLTKK